MYARHPIDTAAFASHVSAERIQRAAEERRARESRRTNAHRHRRQAPPLRHVGRLLVRLGIALGGGPETPTTTTLSTVPPR